MIYCKNISCKHLCEDNDSKKVCAFNEIQIDGEGMCATFEPHDRYLEEWCESCEPKDEYRWCFNCLRDIINNQMGKIAKPDYWMEYTG